MLYGIWQRRKCISIVELLKFISQQIYLIFIEMNKLMVWKLNYYRIASGQNSIRYIWFPRLSDAIRMNTRMEEELYVDKYYKRYCNGVRKTGI